MSICDFPQTMTQVLFWDFISPLKRKTKPHIISYSSVVDNNLVPKGLARINNILTPK